MRNILKLVVLASSFFSGLLYSFEFEKVQGDDLSPYETVYTAFQDQEGYLWIGTGAKGFIRYSGGKFEIHDPSYQLGKMTHVRPMSHLIDGDDLWIATRNGVNKVNIKTLKNKVYESGLSGTPDWETPTKLRQGYINVLLKFEGDEERIYFIGTRYIFYFDKKTEEFIKIVDYRTLEKPHFWKGDIIDQQLWIGMVGRKAVYDKDGKIKRKAVIGGVHIFDKEGNLIKILHNKFDSKFPEDFNIITALKAVGDVMYIGTNKGLYSYNSKTDNLIKLSEDVIAENPIYQLELGFDAKLWASGNKIFEVDLVDGHTVQHYAGDPKTPYTTLFVDNEGTVWVSYSGGGLYKKTRIPPSFKSIDPFIKVGLSFYDHQIKSWAFEGDKIWLGTSSGLIIYDYESQKAEVVKGLEKEMIRSIAMGSEYAWIATREKVFKINLATKQYKQEEIKKNDSTRYPFKSIGGIVLAEDRYLWISFEPSVGVLDTHTGIFTLNPEWIPKRVVTAGSATIAYSSKYKKLLFSAFGTGFYEVDVETKEVIEYLRGTNHVPPADEGVIEVFEDHAMIYYWENVVVEYSFATKKMTPLTFPVKNIDCIIPHSDGENIWLFQGDGKAYLYNKSTKKAHAVSEIHDPQKQTLISGLCKRINKNTVIAGTYGGLAVFNELQENEAVKSANEAPIRAFLSVDNDEYARASSIEMIEPNFKKISLRFNYLSFSDPQKNKILVKVDGVHDWSEYQGSSAEEDYYTLDSGEYSVLYKGINPHGEETQTYSFALTVKEIWYKKSSFIFLVITAALLLALAFIRRKLRSRDREIQKHKRQAEKHLKVFNVAQENHIAAKTAQDKQNMKAYGVIRDLMPAMESSAAMANMIESSDPSKPSFPRYLKTLINSNKQAFDHANVLSELLFDGSNELMKQAKKSPEDVISIAISSVSEFAEISNIKIENSILRMKISDSASVTTDFASLENALVNALYNGLSRAPTGSVLHVFARISEVSHTESDASLVIKITDQGKPLSQDELNQVLSENNGGYLDGTFNKAASSIKNLDGEIVLEHASAKKGNTIIITVPLDYANTDVIEEFVIALPETHLKDGTANTVISEYSDSIIVYDSIDNIAQISKDKVVNIIAVDLRQFSNDAEKAIIKLSSLQKDANLSNAMLIAITTTSDDNRKSELLSFGFDDILLYPYGSAELGKLFKRYKASKSAFGNIKF